MPHTASTQPQTATQPDGLRQGNNTHSPATAETTDQARKLKAVPLSPHKQPVPSKVKAPGQTAPASATPNTSTNHDPTIRLAWPHRIRWTRHALSIDNPTLAQAFAGEPHTSADANDQAPSSRCLAFVDEGFLACHPGLPEQLATCLNHHRASDACHTPELVACILLPGGETVKDGMTHILTMLEAMQQHGIDRHSFVLAIGGGAVLDAVGFAASIAHRGVRLVRMPTTTLAQCDSGVGVKNAVNLLGEKNFAGSFQVPWAIVNDLAFLETLTRPVWRQGWSEVVKVALLKDAGLYATLEAQALALSATSTKHNPQAAEPFWQASAKLHIDHIALGGDPFEAQRARPLDFGHWSAHRLEQLSNHALSHGDAVAIGLAIDMAYAAKIGLIDPNLARSVHRLLETLGFDLWHPTMANPQAILDGLESFRQHLGGQLTITMVQAPGQPIDLHQINHAEMIQAIASLNPASAPGNAPGNAPGS